MLPQSRTRTDDHEVMSKVILSYDNCSDHDDHCSDHHDHCSDHHEQ